MIAVFHSCTNIPEVSELLTILLIPGNSVLTDCFTSLVGIGSAGQVVGLDFMIISSTSDSETGLKHVNRSEHIVPRLGLNL